MFVQRQMAPWTQRDKKLGQEVSKAEVGPDVMESDSAAGTLSHHQLVQVPGVSKMVPPLLQGLTV